MSATLRTLNAARLAGRRFASTSSTVDKASEAASSASQKASQAASSAQAQASNAASNAQAQASAYASKATAALGDAGSRASNLLGAYREPVMSRLAVAREVGKQVYIAERLAPPSSVAEVQHITSQAYARAQDPRFWQELVKSGQWRMFGLYALEAYFIFKIGEMIGRRSIVGYSLSEPALVEHH